MNLGNLYDHVTTSDNYFLGLYQQEDLLGCKTLDEAQKVIGKIFYEADVYAQTNNIEYTYFQLAKKPLWEQLEVKEQHFILKGFDAYINIDLTEHLQNIKPFVVVQNGNVNDLVNGQRIEITEQFINDLLPLHREIFLEALHVVEKETVQKLQQVWKMEQKRIDKWVNTSRIKL